MVFSGSSQGLFITVQINWILLLQNFASNDERAKAQYRFWVEQKSNSENRGLAVNFRKKCVEMRWKVIIFTAYLLHLFPVNAVNNLCSPRSRYSYKLESSLHGFEPQLTSFMPLTAHSTAPNVTHVINISCEFQSDWVNVGKQMRLTFARSAMIFAVNFCK